MARPGRNLRLLLSALALTATPAHSQARVVIDVARREGPVSPLLFGQFLEFMYEGIKGGLHAELLRGRGFEEAPDAIGLPRPWERYPDDRNDDYALDFRWDDSVAFAVRADSLTGTGPSHALRVDAGDGVIARHGIYQPRVPVRGGVPYTAQIWLRAADYTGPVVLALEEDASGGRVYAEWRVDVAPGAWRRYAVVLHPMRSDPLARFVVLFPGRGRVWLDQASLMPADTAPGGVRRDVYERVRALRPAFIRWPGGNVAQDYHWRWGVGPRDERPTWVNLSWKREPEPSDFGTDEFIAFARSLGAEPSLTVNVDGRGATPEEAAAWVEYCNGPATSRWGAVRAANGHPAPYGVTLWEVGNEIWGDWVRGHTDAATYAGNFRRYRDAMRAVDSTIRFIAVGDNDMAWNRIVLRAVGLYVDYLAIHHYYGFDSTQRDLRHLMARPLGYERFYADVARLIRDEVPGHAVALTIDEWGLALPEARQHGMDAALYGARLMNVFERTPVVAMSAVSDLVNGWPGGIVQASRHALFVTPLYHANRLYATHLGRERVGVALTGAPTFGVDSSGAPTPALDVVATRADSLLYVMLVNTDPARDVRVRVEVRGGSVQSDATWELLAEPDGRRGSNGFATPDAIAPRRRPLRAGSAFVVDVPARSVSALTLRVRGG
ncbi:alpha-L-arabinofuranosidase domain protein [Gemmatirosa kalamazoonensis]|uniref:non-reducing end alpha-L-arabinofuranosidase n=1 Tax=Gemmatirosa kalamazoonensis TaxID=861299 RepID=W0RF66_9BACT|nr:alpha-L-arabinofuranosidase C-terminal domain-containing protein [Gemmatirosa kalamazoonensis]AHG89087.1 alpha-L-arabinofuranosidase domain protein [Gemmatirosa kalamazoonensis]